MKENERKIMGDAATRHGLITAADARRLGLTYRMVETRLASGRWVGVGRGVYRLAGVPVTWEQRVLATCLLGGRGAVASHHSAAVLWGLGDIVARSPEITVPRGSSARRARQVGRVYYSDLGGRETARRGAIPVTTAERTLLDLALRLPWPRLVDLVDDVVCRGKCTPGGLRGYLVSFGSNYPGRGKLYRVLTEWTPGPLPGSKEEMRVARILSARRIEPPERQHEIWDDGSLVARVDLAWPSRAVALELQSLRWHGPPERFHADRGRILKLKALGWDVIEVTPRLLNADGGALLCRAVSQA
ncbi:MAG: type IV toxin-antitoxin system AbiEi family antitoxin domain-containing protein, partial [Acidimicrobiales bacterium]